MQEAKIHRWSRRHDFVHCNCSFDAIKRSASRIKGLVRRKKAIFFLRMVWSLFAFCVFLFSFFFSLQEDVGLFHLPAPQLVQHTIETNEQILSRRINTLTQLVVDLGREDALELLCDSSPELINECNRDGWTCLCWCCNRFACGGKEEREKLSSMIRLLLRKKANPRIPNSMGQWPTAYIVESGDVVLCSEMLKHGALVGIYFSWFLRVLSKVLFKMTVFPTGDF